MRPTEAPSHATENGGLHSDDFDMEILKRSVRLSPKSSKWARALRLGLGPKAKKTTFEASDSETERQLALIMEGPSRSGNSSNNGAIPVFYKQKPAPNSLAARVNRLARIKFLKKQAEGLLDQSELELLWYILRENRTPPDDELGAERINFDDFSQVAALCDDRIGPKAKRFFNAATFLTFEADDHGRIAILPLYLYIMRWVSITQTRIDMCMLDRDADGYLLPHEMESYVKHLVPNLSLLRAMGEAFLPVYCQIVVRKFFFFCDIQRRGKLLIREMVLSPLLSELMELRQDEDESPEAALEATQNWFSLPNVQRLYQTFLILDADGNGMLSKTELQSFADGNLTDIFIERVFDEQVRRARNGSQNLREMDLINFVDLVLALENRHTPEGLAYLFRCLDVSGRGRLSAADVYTLFRSVHQRWTEAGNYELAIADVKDEIWDMVKPADPLFITLEDLIHCQQGHTVVSMLVDVGGFWAHDNRETLVAQRDGGAQEEVEGAGK